MSARRRRPLEVGQAVRVNGARGSFVVRAITDKTVTCWGGPANRESYRSFAPERVRPIRQRRRAVAS